MYTSKAIALLILASSNIFSLLELVVNLYCTDLSEGGGLVRKITYNVANIICSTHIQEFKSRSR